MFADGKTRTGSSPHTSVKSTLYRNGTKIAEAEDALDGSGEFKVPAAEATYKLNTSIKRSVKVAAASTRIDESWTFKSKKAGSAELPVSTARFGASLGLYSRGAADKRGNKPTLSVYNAYYGR
jgi:hypothetical protein